MKTKLLYLTLFIFLNASVPNDALAQTEVMQPGAFIVNTGITPQTFNNGLKPYGLIYDLIKNHQVPIKWSIEPTKVKDGVDFIYNSVNYRGGPFIVPAEYITSTVAARISYWQGQGVAGVYTTASITVPVHSTITNFPVIMIDSISNLQSIIINYYTIAGIDSTGYFIGAPAGLNQCFDIWTNPHGDPNWTTHGPLYNFVTQIKGWIWGQCHAVSMLEDVVNPSPPFEQLNFLSQNGLKCWQSGACGVSEFHALSAVSPFTNYYPADPEMQYMLNLNLATQAGSERWYHPLSTGGWRAQTKVGVSTGTGISPNQGVLAVYGYAYGDSTNGRVMYVAGHDLTSGGGGTAIQHKVSAIRTYFNFMLLAGKARQLNATASLPPDTLASADTYPVSATVTTGTPPYTFEWTHQHGGSYFDNPGDSSTVYHAPTSTVDTFDIVRIKVTDLCGRVNFVSKRIHITGAPLPVTLVSFSASAVEQGVELNWSTVSEINNDYFTLERSPQSINFQPVVTVNGAGNSNSLINYSWTDTKPVNGLGYYRLIQTDYDGALTIFGPISIRTGETSCPLSLINIYFNPFTNELSITWHSENKSLTLIEIVDVTGKHVWSEILKSVQGTNHYKLKVKNPLPDGFYFVSLLQSETKVVMKMIVKK